MRYYRAAPLTLKTLGPTQRELLLAARQTTHGYLRADRGREYMALLRMQEHGLFSRGQTRADFTITQKGRDLHG